MKIIQHKLRAAVTMRMTATTTCPQPPQAMQSQANENANLMEMDVNESGKRPALQNDENPSEPHLLDSRTVHIHILWTVARIPIYKFHELNSKHSHPVTECSENREYSWYFNDCCNNENINLCLYMHC